MTKERLKQYRFLKNELLELMGSSNTAASTERIKAIQHEISEIEAFINGLHNSELRQIFQYRSIQGLKWKAISRKIYGYISADRPRNVATRYLERRNAHERA